MRRLILIAGTLLVGADAQTPRPFVPPTLKGDRNVKAQEAVAATDDPVANYANRHEAALAALKTAVKMDRLKGNPDRIINLLLVAAKRDPTYSKAMFNLGVLCARVDRWEDAINFYQEVGKIEPDSATAKAAADELERVHLLTSLQATPEGKRRLQYDDDLMQLLNANKDPAITLDRLNRVIKVDNSRWEGFALKGRLEAALGRYPESAHSLETASRLAPAERRRKLSEAAETAKREALYEDAVHNAELAMEKHEYEMAGKLYASAWQTSPAQVAVAMQAGVGYLMADEVANAVEILQRVRNTGVPEYADKAAAMLKELSAVSPEAGRSGSVAAEKIDITGADPAKEIETAVGELVSARMKLETKPTPPLLDDPTQYTEVPDVELSKANETPFLSTESIFAQYRRLVPVPEPPPATETPVAPAASIPAPVEDLAKPAQLDTFRPPLDRPSLPPVERPSTPAVRSASGGFILTTEPAGASVVFDDNPALSCTSPCTLPLTPGRHTFLATLKGYRDARGIPMIDKNGGAPVNLVFEAKQGVIYIRSEFSGASLYVDGKKIDQVAPTKLILPEGEHEIGLEVNGNIAKQTVKVLDGDGATLTFK